MDIFSTHSMLGAVHVLKTTNNFLLKQFFPIIQMSNDEEIHFDVIERRRRLAPFVSPVVAGQVVDSKGFTTKTFKPAYIKDKRVFDQNRPLKRAVGETIGGSFEPGHRVDLLLAQELADQIEMIDLRLETMASEVLRTGAVTISGDQFPAQNVNFGRDSELTINLAGPALWSDPGTDPLDDVQDWAQMVLQKTGTHPIDVVMTVDVWKVFRRKPSVEAEMNRFQGNASLEPNTHFLEGGVFMGTISGLNIYTYAGWFVDDDGVEQKMIPDGTVLMSSPGLKGIRAFGAIRDHDANFQAHIFFPKSWVEKDPSIRYLLMQSAPLLVPAVVNGSLAATVL